MMMDPRLLFFLLWIALLLPSSIASCSPHSCQLLDPCSTADDCASGLYCGNCPASGKTQPSCTRGQATLPTSIVTGLPYNKYAWLVTHNSFSILNEPSSTGVQRVTFYNQEDTVTNQLTPIDPDGAHTPHHPAGSARPPRHRLRATPSAPALALAPEPPLPFPAAPTVPSDLPLLISFPSDLPLLISFPSPGPDAPRPPRLRAAGSTVCIVVRQ